MIQLINHYRVQNADRQDLRSPSLGPDQDRDDDLRGPRSQVRAHRDQPPNGRNQD